MTLKLPKILTDIISGLIPTQGVRVIDGRHEPDSFLSSIDADTMHGILMEAQEGYTERLFTLYRDIMVDSHLLGEFQKRKLAVLKETPSFSTEHKDKPEDVAAMDEIRQNWKQLKGKREALTHLLDSTLYPVALLEKIWKISDDPERQYKLDKLVPVPHHLLDYRDGCLKIRKIDTDGRPLEEYFEPDCNRYIIHRGHLLTSVPDKWGGPMRAVLFWWLFKTMSRDWWARFLERFGSPFLVGKYNSGDDRSRAELAHAFRQATRLFGLTIPDNASVEMVQSASSQTGDAFKAFHEVANAEISKLIVGQTMTSEAQAGGIGGTQATVHQAVRDDIATFDAVALAETLQEQLFRPHLRINGYAAAVPDISFGGQGEADAKATVDYMAALEKGGFEPADEAADYLSKVGGFPVRRKQQPVLPLSAGNPGSRLASNAAAAVSQSLRNRHASIPEIVAMSSSPADLEDKLIEAFGTQDDTTANLIADTLAAHAINGVTANE